MQSFYDLQVLTDQHVEQRRVEANRERLVREARRTGHAPSGRRPVRLPGVSAATKLLGSNIPTGRHLGQDRHEPSDFMPVVLLCGQVLA
jgi:hypothetical protein